MINRTSALLITLLVTVAGCRQASFLKQRYTHYGHSKAAAGGLTATRHTKEAGVSAGSRHEAQLVADAGRVSPGHGDVDFARALPPAMPARHHPFAGYVTLQPATAKNEVSNAGEMTRTKAAPVRLRKSGREKSTGIPIISPLLRLVFLILLVALVILLVIILI